MKRFLLSFTFLALFSSSAFAQSGAPRGIAPCAPNSITATSPSANVQLSTCGNTLLIMNLSAQEAFYKVGSASTTAATTTVTDSYSIPGNSFEMIVVPGLAGQTGWYFAAITAASTATLRLIQGNAQ